MAIEATRPTKPPLLTMELLEASAMKALLDGGLSEANRICGRQLPPFFLEEGWLWQIRLDQIRTSPQDAPWLVRVAVLEPSGMVIGHAGFHGPPDPAGAVEIDTPSHPSTVGRVTPMRYWRYWSTKRGHTRT